MGAALNLWDAEPALVAERSGGADGHRGHLGRSAACGHAPVGRRCGRLQDAGASWVIFGWPVDLEELVAAGRDAALGERSGATQERVVGSDDGVPPDQRAAALRVRDHQRSEGVVTASRPRRHRPRVRQPRPALAARGGGQARRGRAQPAQPPLLGLARHPEAAQRHLRPLPAQVRRRARPRDRGRARPSEPRRVSRTSCGCSSARGHRARPLARPTRSTSGDRSSPAPTCARSAARAAVPADGEPDPGTPSSRGLHRTRGRSRGPSHASSCCRSRTTRRLRVSTSRSWNGSSHFAREHDVRARPRLRLRRPRLRRLRAAVDPAGARAQGRRGRALHA